MSFQYLDTPIKITFQGVNFFKNFDHGNNLLSMFIEKN